MEDFEKDKDYLKDLAPHLFSKEMDEERSIPEGYFDSFEENVLAKVKAEDLDEPQGKTRSLVNFRNLSIAAGVAVLLAVVPFLRNMNTTEDPIAESESIEATFDQIDETAAELYLAEEYDIESIAMEIELSSVSSAAENDLSSEEILDYLMDSDISESLLYESL